MKNIFINRDSAARAQRPRTKFTITGSQISAACLSLLLILLLAGGTTVAARQASQQQPASKQEASAPADSSVAASRPSAQSAIGANPASAAAMVTEFDVNGLKVLVKRRAGSQTVAAGLFLRGGSRNLTAQNAGIEAFMLDVSSEASANYPRERMRTELARMGTVIGYGVQYDYSALSLRCTRLNFDHSWDIFTDVALRPTFSPEDVELVRNRLIASLRDEGDDPDSYLELLQARAAYMGHPYLNRPQGTAETISHITVNDLRRYHQQMMETSRLLLVIVGDLDAATLHERIAASFGRLPRGDYHAQPPPQLSFTAPSVEVTAERLPTNYVQGLFAAPPLTSPDIYPMRVASSILYQRIFQEVRVRRNLSYAPNAFLGSQAQTSAVFT